MKKLILTVIIFCFLNTPVCAGGWDFYFFGVNPKTFKEANYWKVAAGAITSVAVHTAGHYAYAGLNRMSVRQDGFKEVVGYGYANREYREFAQAGFLVQNLVGLVLTSIPATRQSDFTKGYVAMAFFEIVTEPLFWPGENGDLNISNRHGGDATWEYIGFTALATHNVLRINWKKE